MLSLCCKTNIKYKGYYMEQRDKNSQEELCLEVKKSGLDSSLCGVEIPDLGVYDFPSDYDAFEDENLNMLP